MKTSIYSINKGINSPIEFKGLKGQYIWYAGAGVMLLLILFGLMYAMGISNWLSLIVIAILGSYIIYKIYSLSNRYGTHGLMKVMAKKGLPKLIHCSSRKVFQNLTKVINKRNDERL